MKNRKAILFFLIVVIIAIGVAFLKIDMFSKKVNFNGCIIGNDNSGFSVIFFPSCEKRSLLPKKANKSVESPVITSEDSTIYYVDLKLNLLMRCKNIGGDPVEIYKISKNHRVDWLLLCPEESNLFFMEYMPGNPPTKLIKYNLKSESFSVLFSHNFYPYQRPTWIDKSNLLLLTYNSGGGKGLQLRLEMFNIESLKISTVLNEAGYFAIANNLRKILINKSTGDYVLYKFPEMTKIKQLPKGLLPDNTKITSPFSFINDDKVLFWRWIGRQIGLGTYLVDLDTLEYNKITEDMLSKMLYFSDTSKFENFLNIGKR